MTINLIQYNLIDFFTQTFSFECKFNICRPFLYFGASFSILMCTRFKAKTLGVPYKISRQVEKNIR